MGGATAAYQIEGATKKERKRSSSWDVLKNKGGYPDPAADFYHRYDEDLALAEAYGHQVIRLSIPRSQFPDGAGRWNLVALLSIIGSLLPVPSIILSRL